MNTAAGRQVLLFLNITPNAAIVCQSYRDEPSYAVYYIEMCI